MTFKNPANDYEVEVNNLAILWAILFGPLYFIVHSVWSHFFISLVLAVLTMGLSVPFYALAAPQIVRNKYMSNGWVAVQE